MKRFTFLNVKECTEVNFWNLTMTDIQEILEDGLLLVSITTETEDLL